MQDKLYIVEFFDFNHLVDRAIIVETKINKIVAKNRKYAAPQPMGGSAPHPRPKFLPPARMPGYADL